MWFQHMIGMGFLSRLTLARAFASRDPFFALERLYAITANRLAGHLESQVRRYTCDRSLQGSPAVEVSLEDQGDGEPYLVVKFSQYYRFDVSSLHHVPRRLAACVHESFELIARALLPCMVPGTMWRDEMNYCGEEVQEEYRQVRVLQARDPAALQRALAKGEFNFFNSDPESLEEELTHMHAQLFCQPPWMRSGKDPDPVRRARQLSQAAHQYEIEFGVHPWSQYVREVSSVLLKFHPTSHAFEHHRIGHSRCLGELQEFEADLAFGVWVNSATPTESRHADNIFELMGSASEYPCARYRLRRLATPRLLGTLNALANGFGLLYRADDINTALDKRPP
jgi:hypothetical protein